MSVWTNLIPERKIPVIHPLLVRVTHWINAFAMIVMIMSGWQIHNSYPTLPFSFPDSLTLGGSLPGALQWHFAAMWVLTANGITYVTYGIISGRFRRKLLPIRPSEVLRDVRGALAGGFAHTDLSVYNAVQRARFTQGSSARACLPSPAAWPFGSRSSSASSRGCSAISTTPASSTFWPCQPSSCS